MKKTVLFVSLILLISCQNQPNTTKPAHASVNEKMLLALGGENQYVEITGLSKSNPVLLFLHGGPGWPQTPQLRYFNSGLTKKITLVSWDQAGCGKSFMNNRNPGNLSLNQLVSDAHELTQFLKKKFNQKKIFLAGFSWGSMIGLKLVEQYPEDYAAYFGISQVVNLRKSIAQSREWITEQAALNGDHETIKTLKQIGLGDTSLCKGDLDCFMKQYELLNKYGGAIYRKESEIEIQKAVTYYPDYKNYNWEQGYNYSVSRLGNDMFETDLSNIQEVKIPVWFLVGRHDWNIPGIVTEEFVWNLRAPSKGIIWFEQSGHEPLEEESEKFNQTIIDLVMQNYSLF